MLSPDHGWLSDNSTCSRFSDEVIWARCQAVFSVLLLIVIIIILVQSSGLLSTVGITPSSESGETVATAGSNRTAGSAAGVAGAPLRISEDDVNYLNRIFRERTHEIAYCGFMDEGELHPWLADTVRASNTSVDFTIANCRDGEEQGELNATIHTHSNGVAQLSQRDVATLRNSSFEVMCIQSGQITAEETDRTEKFRCYRLTGPDTGQIQELPVITLSE